jgi:leucyl aminopeptidase (aminopeptidase T)
MEMRGVNVTDARVERYAELLLDTCLGVQRGWEVLVWSTPWARPLLEEIMRQLGKRGAYPLLRLTFSGDWSTTAPGSRMHRSK